VVAFGSLIKSTEPEGIDLAEKVSFLGIGFGYNAIPIDIVGLFLAGLETREYSLLLVDEFQRFNNVPEEHIGLGLRRTQRALGGLSRLYGFEPEIIISSSFMRSEEYREVLEETEQKIEDQGCAEKVLQTVPEKFRDSPNAIVYPLNEIACVEFLRRERGIEVKLGPSKELAYDRIMRELGLGIDFAYVIDAYALGTREPEEVVHYIPNHRGLTNGQRVFLDEPMHKAYSKLLLGPEEASRFLLRLASASGHRLGKDYLSEDDIRSLHGKKLKKITTRFVLENILGPYKEVVQDER
jgi:hypothetical protein